VEWIVFASVGFGACIALYFVAGLLGCRREALGIAALPIAAYLLFFVPSRYAALFESIPAVLYHPATDRVGTIDVYPVIPYFWKWKYMIPFIGKRWLRHEDLVPWTVEWQETLEEQIEEERRLRWLIENASAEERNKYFEARIDSLEDLIAEAEQLSDSAWAITDTACVGVYPRPDISAELLVPLAWGEQLTEVLGSDYPVQVIDLVMAEQTTTYSSGNVGLVVGQPFVVDSVVLIKGKQAVSALLRRRYSY